MAHHRADQEIRMEPYAPTNREAFESRISAVAERVSAKLVAQTSDRSSHESKLDEPFQFNWDFDTKWKNRK
jgi:hypothetical protein